MMLTRIIMKLLRAELLDGYMDYDSYEEENAGKVYTYR